MVRNVEFIEYQYIPFPEEWCNAGKSEQSRRKQVGIKMNDLNPPLFLFIFSQKIRKGILE